MARKTFYLAALAGALVSACGPVNQGLESVHQPVVSRTDYVLDVAGGFDGLAEGEAARLDAWFRSLELGYGDIVYVDSAEPVRRAAVSTVASRYGLLVSPGAPVTAGTPSGDAVRVVVSRNAASVQNCPNFDRLFNPEFEGSTSSNYGCATNGNLAAMIANPEDLVRGRESTGTTDVRTASKAVKTYRDAEPTGKSGLKIESTKGGN